MAGYLTYYSVSSLAGKAYEQSVAVLVALQSRVYAYAHDFGPRNHYHRTCAHLPQPIPTRNVSIMYQSPDAELTNNMAET
jgi:hypothetical protein